VVYQVDGGAAIVDPAPIDGTFTLSGLAPGVHTLTGYLARSDQSKIAGSDAVALHFSVPAPPDTIAPTVSVTAPAAGATVSGVVTVTATAQDNVGVTSVQFQVDGQALGTPDTTAPYSVSWDSAQSANGSHRLTAVARDAATNTTTSAEVTVTVANVAAPKTLGYTAVGTIVDSGYFNSIHTWRYVMPNETGTAQSISVYIAGPVSNAPNNQFSVAIYADQGGRPGARIAMSAAQAVVGNAWNTVPITATLQANTAYWLAYNTNATTTQAQSVRLAPGTGEQMGWRSQSFGNWPTQFGAFAGGVPYQGSIYVTYRTP
jgi:hypothetical protein